MTESLVIPAGEHMKIYADDSASFSAGMDISVFGIKLLGLVTKETDGMRVLVAPGSETPKQSVTLEDMLIKAGLNDSISSATDVLGYVGLSCDLAIDVNQVYLYHSNIPSDTGANGKTSEYAFSIGISGDATSKTEGILTINNVFFSVWNSQREGIKKSLGLADIGEVLKRIS